MEIGRNPVIEHQIQPECGDEQVGAGRDGLTYLAKLNSQARTGQGNIKFRVHITADHEQDYWQP